MRGPAHQSPQRGFTLIEVMLAIVLLALLLAGTFGAVRTAVRASHSGEQAIDRINRVRVAQEFMRRQISRIMPLSYDSDPNTGERFLFEGDATSMRFVAPMPGYLSRGGAYVQSLRLVRAGRGMELEFSNVMLNGFDPEFADPDAEPVVLLNQISSGRFEYRTMDDQGEMTAWSDRWEDPGVTPVMVRISIDMADDARIDFPDMEIAPMLDVAAVRPGSARGGQRRNIGRPIGRNVPPGAAAQPAERRPTRRAPTSRDQRR